MVPTARNALFAMSHMDINHTGHSTHTGNWNQLEDIWGLQQATSLIRLKAPELSRLIVFSTLPFQLDRRDWNLLFHCELLFIVYDAHFCGRCM
jgi:hypothetical protein